MTIVQIFVLIAVSLLLAFLAEAMTEYLVGTPLDKFPKAKKYKWLIMYVSAGVGVVMAFFWKLDLVAVTANFVAMLMSSPFDWAVSWLGCLFTGLSIGRGANFVHGMLSRYLKKPDLTEAPKEEPEEEPQYPW